jgi:hypothetical protein
MVVSMAAGQGQIAVPFQSMLITAKDWADTCRELYFEAQKGMKSQYDIKTEEKDIIIGSKRLIPNIKLTAVSSGKGWKTRIASLTNIGFTSVLAPLHDQVIKILRSCGPFSGAFDADPTKIAARLSKGFLHNAFLVASDLSYATNYIDHRGAAAAVRGMAKALAWEPLQLEAALASVGPANIIYGRGNKSFISNRGTQMGLPLSFSVLCFLHWYACEKVAATNTGLANYVIYGDDFAARWPREALERYNIEMTRLGFKVNSQKATISRSSVPFCNELYKIRCKTQKHRATPSMTLGMHLHSKYYRVAKDKYFKTFGHIMHIPRPKLSAIMMNNLERDDPGQSTSPIFKFPSIYANETAKAPKWMRKHIIKVMHIRCARWIRELRKWYIPVSWPQELGGAGAPGRSDATSLHRRVAGRLCSISSKSDRLDAMAYMKHWWIVNPRYSDIAGDVSYYGRQLINQLPTCRSPLTRKEVAKDVEALILSQRRLIDTESIMAEFPPERIRRRTQDILRTISLLFMREARRCTLRKPMKPSKARKLAKEMDTSQVSPAKARQLVVRLRLPRIDWQSSPLYSDGEEPLPYERFMHKPAPQRRKSVRAHPRQVNSHA